MPSGSRLPAGELDFGAADGHSGPPATRELTTEHLSPQPRLIGDGAGVLFLSRHREVRAA